MGGISSLFLMMKGLLLIVLALFVASCQMKNYLIETESAGSFNSFDAKFCKVMKSRVRKNCNTPKKRNTSRCESKQKAVELMCKKGTDYLLNGAKREPSIFLKLLEDSL